MTDAREALVALIRSEYAKHPVDRYPTEGALADAILTEFDVTPPGERVKPTVEDVARVLHADDLAGRFVADDWGGLSNETRGWYLSNARAVLALLPGRTEAEVKAKALREAADAFTNADVFTTEEQREFAAWLMVRANTIEKEARANSSSFDLAMQPYRAVVRPSGQEGS